MLCFSDRCNDLYHTGILTHLNLSLERRSVLCQTVQVCPDGLQVYCDPTLAYELVDDIIEATMQPMAPSAFASIICAPRSRLSFEQMLQQMGRDQVPVLMCYGREDPWVLPEPYKRILHISSHL